MRKCISVDWLQLFCDASEAVEAPGYLYNVESYGTSNFKKITNISLNREPFCSIASEPTSSFMPANSCIVKFKNRLLYSHDFIVQIQVFLEFSNLKVKGITRLDIAVDFNNFFDSLSPHTFIRRFLKSTYLKNGRGTFTVIGEQKFMNNYQYLRFGSKTSDVSVYLYNKTIELRQVQDKPYIKNRWKVYGIDTNVDVWRLEVSIKSQACKFVDLESGEMIKINWERLQDHDYLYNVYYSFINQNFSFKINDGFLNKSRMKNLRLFDDSRSIYKRIKLPEVTGSNQSDKVFLKKLYLLDKELRGMKNENQLFGKILLDKVAANVSLDRWVEKNKDKWDKAVFREY